jgi:hypothetical protein
MTLSNEKYSKILTNVIKLMKLSLQGFICKGQLGISALECIVHAAGVEYLIT